MNATLRRIEFGVDHDSAAHTGAALVHGTLIVSVIRGNEVLELGGPVGSVLQLLQGMIDVCKMVTGEMDLDT